MSPSLAACVLLAILLLAGFQDTHSSVANASSSYDSHDVESTRPSLPITWNCTIRMICTPYTLVKKMILAQRHVSIKGGMHRALELANNLALRLRLGVNTFVRGLYRLSAVVLSPCEPHGPLSCSSAILALQKYVGRHAHFVRARVGAEVSHLASQVIAVLSDTSLVSRSKAFVASLENRQIEDLLSACRSDVHLHYFSSVQSLSSCPRMVNLEGIQEISPCKSETFSLKSSANVSSCSCSGYAGLKMFVKLLVQETLEVKFNVIEDEIVSDQVKRRVHLSGTETQHGRAAMAAQEALFNMKLGFDKLGRIYKITYSVQSIRNPRGPDSDSP